ncbi:MAG TPA: sodium:solute symporter, partial [Gemmatimonadaceae bacterium]|nr:sodium:solute symporter [Gemmatimonadaceae bacterium]
RAGVYTAYQYLEQRFDSRTRTLTSLLFLLSRGLSVGVTLYAPSIVLAVIFGWSETATIAAMAGATIVYVVYGGNRSVIWTDVAQMALVWFGILTCFTVAVTQLPAHFGLRDALALAQATGRLEAVDTSLDPARPFTLWSGLVGGMFLAMAYFGCDQSQVQRYLSGRSLTESRLSLLFNAFLKVPMQFLILLTGVLVFVFFLFSSPPLLFNPVKDQQVRSSARAPEFAAIERDFSAAASERGLAGRAIVDAHNRGDQAGERGARDRFAQASTRVRDLRAKAGVVVRDVTHDDGYTRFTGEVPASDVNYIFPRFVTSKLPMGLVGLIVAAIFAAAMSAIAGELNAVATATTIDIYKRHLKPVATDAEYLRFSRWATAFWGLFACGVAMYATTLGSLIEVVNRFGSFFYGSLLGVFILAVGTKRAVSAGAFWGLLAGMAVVATVAFHPATRHISFLWHNVIGSVVVVVVGMTISLVLPARTTEGRVR